jgi:glucokinase
VFSATIDRFSHGTCIVALTYSKNKFKLELMPSESKMRRRSSRGGTGRFKIKHETIAAQQAELLRHIRAREGLSRVDLARILNLAPSTIGIYVDHLVEEGFIFEGKARERDFGRPPTILALNPQGGRFIGVDFEARNIMAIAADFSQKPLKRFHDTIAPGDSVESILQKIEHAIKTVIAGDDRKVLGIGIGVPGVIDLASGVASNYKHIKGWESVPLVGRLANRFGVPVFLENNIRTMALAELWFGQGRGLRNFICIGMRSGISAGIVVDGRIYHGGNNRAGEIGDWPCTPPASTTKAGCTKGFVRLEEIASLKSVQHGLPRSLVNALESRATGETDATHHSLVKAAQSGDQRVLGILDRLANAIAVVLNQLQCAFDPQKIILAGAFPIFGDLFLNRLHDELKRLAPPSGAPLVANSTLGDFNGALGAAALAVHEWKPITA